MQSKAATVDEYLASLPPDRRTTVAAIRKVILENLDPDYEEGMEYGAISYSVPHRVFPAGYHANPKVGLPFAAIASQKNYISIYLMGLYCGCIEGVSDTALVKWFKDAWAKSGKKKLDMGKACIRFKKLDDIPLDVIGEAIRRVPARVYVDQYVKARG
jgi:uncharacterized protein DUF1801